MSIQASTSAPVELASRMVPSRSHRAKAPLSEPRRIEAPRTQTYITHDVDWRCPGSNGTFTRDGGRTRSTRRSVLLQPSKLDRVAQQIGAGVEPQLGADAPAIGLDGARADPQLLRDHLVGAAQRERQ